jgi:uncharacterized protein DUF29
MTTPDYETDFYAWTQAQAAAIRAGAWDDVDRDHLAEEIEDVGKSERQALMSHLRVLLTNLLKWEHQPEQHSDSWIHSIGNAQIEMQTILDEIPSLCPELPAFVARAYQQARWLAAQEMLVDRVRVPDTCRWSPDHLLSPDIVPEK